MSNGDPIWNNAFQTITNNNTVPITNSNTVPITNNNTVPLGGYVQVSSVQDLMDIKQQVLLQQQALQAQQYPGWISSQGLAGTNIPPGQGYAINQYRSQVERLLPLYPKSGEIVSLWYDGQQWVKLSGAATGWKEEKTPDVISSFSLDEIAEASDIIDEIEHARVA